MARSTIAEALRTELSAHSRKQTAEERIALAFKLGDEAASLYGQVHGLKLQAARTKLRGRSSVGRKASVASAVDR